MLKNGVKSKQRNNQTIKQTNKQATKETHVTRMGMCTSWDP